MENNTKVIEAITIYDEIQRKINAKLTEANKLVGQDYTKEQENPNIEHILALAEEDEEFKEWLENDSDEKDAGNFYVTYLEYLPKQTEPINKEEFEEAIGEVRDLKTAENCRHKNAVAETILSTRTISPQSFEVAKGVLFYKHALAAISAYEGMGYHIKRKRWLKTLIADNKNILEIRIKEQYSSSGRDRILQNISDNKGLESTGMHIETGQEGNVGPASDADFYWTAGALPSESGYAEELVMDEHLRPKRIKGKKLEFHEFNKSETKEGYDGDDYKEQVATIHGERRTIKIFKPASLNRGTSYQGVDQIIGLDLMLKETDFENSNEFGRLKSEYDKSLIAPIDLPANLTPEEKLQRMPRVYKAENQTYTLDIDATLKKAGLHSQSAGHNIILKELKAESYDQVKQDELRKKFAETNLADED